MTSVASDLGAAQGATTLEPRQVLRRSAATVPADLYLWELLTSLRLPLTVRSFRMLACVAVVSGTGLMTAASVVAASWLHDSGDKGLASMVLIGVVAALTYAAIGLLTHEWLSGQSPVNPADARLPLLCALDLSVARVQLTYALLPRLPLVVSGSAVMVVLVARLGPWLGLTGLESTILITTPVLLAGAGSVGGMLVVTRRTARFRKGFSGLMIFVISTGVGSISGLLWGRAVLAGRRLPSGSPAVWGPGGAETVLVISSALLLAAGLAGALVLRRRWETGTPRWRPTPPATEPRPAPRFTRVLVPGDGLGRSLKEEWVGGPTSVVIRSITRSQSGICGLLVGLVVTGALVPHTVPEPVAAVLVLAALMAAVSLTEALSRPIGPIRLSPFMRVLWELGADPRWLARTVMRVYAEPLLLSTVLTTAMFALLTGHFSLLPAAANGVALGSWVIAECVVPPVVNPDGSAMHNAVSAVMALALSSPIVWCALNQHIWSNILASIYAIVLLGGANACLQRRVLSQPSSSGR